MTNFPPSNCVISRKAYYESVVIIYACRFQSFFYSIFQIGYKIRYYVVLVCFLQCFNVSFRQFIVDIDTFGVYIGGGSTR